LQKLKPLAKDLGIKQINVVANKVRNSEDEDFLKSRIPAEDLLGFVHYSNECATADRKGASPFDTGGGIIEEMRGIKERIGS